MRRQRINVDMFCNVCRIRGLPADQAGELFGQIVDRFLPDHNGCLTRNRHVDLSMAECPYTGEIRIPRCRLDHSVNLLKSRGYDAQVTPYPPQIRRERHPQAVCAGHEPSWVRECERVLLSEMVGRIVVHTSRERRHVLALIALLHRNSNIVVVAPTRREVDELTKHFSTLAAERVTTAATDMDGNTSRIVVATEREFVRPMPEYFQVVVFADVKRCLAKRIVSATLPLHDHWIFAIEDSGSRLTDSESYLAEYLAGTVIYQLPRAEGVSRPLQTIAVNSNSRSCRSLTGLERKRHEIWRNTARNQQIAELVQAIARCDGDIALPVPESTRQMLAEGELKVAILVESPEHGRALQELLPDWLLLKDGDVAMISLNQTIMTQLWASRRSQLDVDVLVRADDSRSPLKLRGFPAKTREATIRPALLVELNGH